MLARILEVGNKRRAAVLLWARNDSVDEPKTRAQESAHGLVSGVAV